MASDFSLAASEPIIRAVLEGGGSFTLSPNGVSMLPTIRPSEDKVTLQRPQGSILRYDILLYKRPDGQFVLHRVVGFKKDGSFVMCGDGQVDLEYGVAEEQIIGVVTDIHRARGSLVRGTAAFRTAGRRRNFTRPLRRVWRVLLRIKRRVTGKKK